MPERIDQIVQDVSELKAEVRAMRVLQKVVCKERDQIKNDIRETRDAVMKMSAKIEGGTAVAGVAMKGGRVLLGFMFALASALGAVVVKMGSALLGL